MPSRVTALVPAWNSEGFVRETLECLRNQDHPDLQVIVSVDLSTDNTAGACEAFARQDSRFQVHRQTERLGWARNSNFLLARAEGPYSFFAFHDDLLDTSYVQRLATVLDANPDAAVAYSDLDLVYLDGRREQLSFEAIDQMDDPVRRVQTMLAWDRHWWVPNRGLFRTDLGQAIGGIQTFLGGEFSADYPWLLHLAIRGRFLRVPGYLCRKRYMKHSLSRSWAFRPIQLLAANLSMVREVLRADVPLDVKAHLLRPVLHASLERLLNVIRLGQRDSVQHRAQLRMLREAPFARVVEALAILGGMEEGLESSMAPSTGLGWKLINLIPARGVRRALRRKRWDTRLSGLHEALDRLDSEASIPQLQRALSGLDYEASPWRHADPVDFSALR